MPVQEVLRLRSILLLISLALVTHAASSQSTATPFNRDGTKRPLSVDSYAAWNSIRGAALSPDGSLVAYSVAPGLGDGEVIVRNLETGQEFRYTRGFIGRQQLTPGQLSNPLFPDAVFTADGLHVLFTIEPSRSEFERLSANLGKGSLPHHFDLAVMDVHSGDVSVLPSVQRFRLPEKGGCCVAYLQAAASTEREPTLSMRHFESGLVEPIAATANFAIDDQGQTLAFSVRSAADGGEVFVRSIETGEAKTVYRGSATPGVLKLSNDGKTLSFFATQHDGSEQHSQLFFVDTSTGTSHPVLLPSSVSARLKLDPRPGVTFSAGDRILVFHAVPLQRSANLDESVSRPPANLELWSWNDPVVEPSSRATSRSVTVTYDLKSSHVTLLEVDSDPNPRATFAAHAAVALLAVKRSYEFEALWRGFYCDYYAVDLTTGRVQPIAKHVQPQGRISPDGRFVVYFDDISHWHAFEIGSGIDRDLTGSIRGVRFDQETWSYPTTVAPWGVAGWTPNDHSVLIYDRYDVWEVDPLGSRSPICVTRGAGRQARRVFRIVTSARDSQTVNASEPLLLQAADDVSKATGYWSAHLGQAQAPRRLLHLQKRLGIPIRASSSSVYLFTQETFQDSPDLWVAQADFASPHQVSRINPQQSEYLWGTSELVSWRNTDGIPIQGVLYKPAGFDPARKYPLVVFIYERLSQHLFVYKPPEPTAEINRTIYVSNDYLVFEPDIQYKIGSPGRSALECVEGGVRSLIARGIVDTKAIGLQGISWGGYEATYIVSHSKLFTAAVLDSPITDIVSDYGEFAYDEWTPRLGGYEFLQNRIGVSLWQDPNEYIANSPIMAANRITVPILMMANDGDGTVSWTQGLELYVALRRLKREVYLVDYHGDQHQPGALGSRLDIARRTQQFFDHYLKHLDPPEWMTASP